MDVKDKIISALRKHLQAAYLRLEDDDGITGFVVSDQFVGMSTLDRQQQIDEALSKASPALTLEEKRRVLMIAGLTQAEYDAVGANIMVFKIQERSGGVIEVLVNGGRSDAEYVRGAFKQLKGVRTTDPKPIASQGGTVMSFRVKGSAVSPLSKDKVLRLLRRQTYVTVTPGA